MVKSIRVNNSDKLKMAQYVFECKLLETMLDKNLITLEEYEKSKVQITKKHIGKPNK